MAFLAVGERNYLLHSFLVRVGLSASDVFGGFLIYEITHSVPLMLAMFSIAYVFGLLARMFGVVIIAPLYKRIGAIPLLASSLALVGFADLALYVLREVLSTNAVALVAIMSLWLSASGIYYLLANAMKYKTISAHSLPGSFSSYIEISKALSYIAVSIAALFLNASDNLILLLAFAAVPLVLSILPLWRSTLLSDSLTEFKFSFRNVFSIMSRRAQAANFSYDIISEFVNPIIPLFLILAFAGSTSIPVHVTGTAFLISTILLYGGGILKDRKNPILIGAASLVLFSTFLLIPFSVHTQFLGVLMLLLGLSRGLINVGFDAEIGREVAQSGNPLGAAVSVETMRAISGLVVMPIFLGFYLMFDTLPAFIFVIGAFGMLPFAAYSLKGAGGVFVANK